MQTLISAFKDQAAARRAKEQLLQAGFDSRDVHVQEPLAPTASFKTGAEDADNREIGERTMDSAEREVAVDEHALEAVGNFFTRLCGNDNGEGHATNYSRAVGRGHSVVVVDARNDSEAEHAAMILHDAGATDVDEHEEGRESRLGVRLLDRDSSMSLRVMADQRESHELSPMATRAGQVTKEKVVEEREERAFAAAKVSSEKDRPH